MTEIIDNLTTVEISTASVLTITVEDSRRLETLLVAQDGQEEFALDFVPLSPSLSELFVNGVRQQYPTDYTINDTLLSWESTDFPLETVDFLSIRYL